MQISSRPRYDVACPKCGVAAGQHCRTLTTGRVTDTHNARIDAQYGHYHSRGCSHWARHTVYGADDPARNGTTCSICGEKL